MNECGSSGTLRVVSSFQPVPSQKWWLTKVRYSGLRAWSTAPGPLGRALRAGSRLWKRKQEGESLRGGSGRLSYQLGRTGAFPARLTHSQPSPLRAEAASALRQPAPAPLLLLLLARSCPGAAPGISTSASASREPAADRLSCPGPAPRPSGPAGGAGAVGACRPPRPRTPHPCRLARARLRRSWPLSRGCTATEPGRAERPSRRRGPSGGGVWPREGGGTSYTSGVPQVCALVNT